MHFGITSGLPVIRPELTHSPPVLVPHTHLGHATATVFTRYFGRMLTFGGFLAERRGYCCIHTGSPFSEHCSSDRPADVVRAIDCGLSWVTVRLALKSNQFVDYEENL
jgi:hypothetical protein